MHSEIWTQFLKDLYQNWDSIWYSKHIFDTFHIFLFSGVPYMSWFNYLQTYGNPENEIWPHFLAQEAQKPVNLNFDFQGSQKSMSGLPDLRRGWVNFFKFPIYMIFRVHKLLPNLQFWWWSFFYLGHPLVLCVLHPLRCNRPWPSQDSPCSTEIGKKAWLFAKLQPGRARKRINAA